MRTKIEILYRDIRLYKVKELPYHFVLFHHLPAPNMLMYKKTLDGRDDDNALLTYCYLDSQAGLSYKAICTAELFNDGSVDFNEPEDIDTAMIIREGGLLCAAEIINEGTEGLERFQDDADFIKEHYGYMKDKVEIRSDIPFDDYRHPSYPKDIFAYFFAESKKIEQIWVTEEIRGDGTVRAILIDEPFNPLMGVHKGDLIDIIPYDIGDGEIVPLALLPWMKG